MDFLPEGGRLFFPKGKYLTFPQAIRSHMTIEFAEGAVLLGPGRWGTTTPSLGVPASFTEISHFTCICEMAYQSHGLRPELSYGSHYFQDLVESGIHYTAIYQGESGCEFNSKLFEQYPNVYEELTHDTLLSDVIRIFDFGSDGAILYSELSSNDCFLAII